jgi:hypothetical protein
MLDLIMKGHTIVRMPYGHLPYHTPPHHGDTAWKIVNLTSGEVVDSYTPRKPKRAKVCTPWEGSWAQSMEES